METAATATVIVMVLTLVVVVAVVTVVVVLTGNFCKTRRAHQPSNQTSRECYQEESIATSTLGQRKGRAQQPSITLSGGGGGGGGSQLWGGGPP